MTSEEADILKLTTMEMQRKVVHDCWQSYGDGSRYTVEYPIFRYADEQIQRICGGTSEIMCNLVARTMQTPTPSAAQQDRALEQAMDYLAERGVTTVHDRQSYDFDSLPVYRRAHTKGAGDQAISSCS